MTELPKIKTVGLTGMSGAGKSTVCEVFEQAGFAVIDCDRCAHIVTMAGSACVKELAKRLSPEIVNGDGSLNRRMTGRMIFADLEKRRVFNKIVFPYIRYYVLTLIKTYAEAGQNVLLDAPTLFEAQVDGICTHIVSVCADKERCAERIMLRDDISREDALNRLNAQHDIEFFRSRSDIVIENNSTLGEVRRAAQQAAERLKGEI